jgi:hypothetical protein
MIPETGVGEKDLILDDKPAHILSRPAWRSTVYEEVLRHVI